MANGFKGEATAQVDGKTFTLRLDFNAMCAFEEATGRDAMEVLEGLERGKYRATDLRALVWSMLHRHHPEATVADAGDILSSDLQALMRVIEAARPQVEPGVAVGNGVRRGKVRPA